MLKVYNNYFSEGAEYFDANYFNDMTREICETSSDNVVKALWSLLEKTLSRKETTEKFTSDDLSVVSEAILSIGSAISVEQIEQFEDDIDTSLDTHDLRFEVMEHLLSVLVEHKYSIYWMDNLLTLMLKKDFKLTRKLMQSMASQDPEWAREQMISLVKVIIQKTYRKDLGLDRVSLRSFLVEFSDIGESQIVREEYQNWFSYLLDEQNNNPKNEAVFDALIKNLNQRKMVLTVSNSNDISTLEHSSESAARIGEPRWILSFIKIIPYLKLTDHLAERVATNLVICAIALGDDDVFNVIENMLPVSLENKALTFNLACYWALKQNIEKMYENIKKSLELGKPKHSFLSDKDFSHYKNDKEFELLVNQYE